MLNSLKAFWFGIKPFFFFSLKEANAVNLSLTCAEGCGCWEQWQKILNNSLRDCVWVHFLLLVTYFFLLPNICRIFWQSEDRKYNLHFKNHRFLTTWQICKNSFVIVTWLHKQKFGVDSVSNAGCFNPHKKTGFGKWKASSICSGNKTLPNNETCFSSIFSCNVKAFKIHNTHLNHIERCTEMSPLWMYTSQKIYFIRWNHVLKFYL